jgi:hypothetical protein
MSDLFGQNALEQVRAGLYGIIQGYCFFICVGPAEMSGVFPAQVSKVYFNAEYSSDFK